MTKQVDKLLLLFSLIAVILMACTHQQPTPNESHEMMVDTTSVVPKKDTVYSLKISAVGDLMVHDYQILRAHRSDTDSFDFSPVFKQVQPYFDEADILLGNLETVFAGKDNGRSNKVLGYSSFPYFNSPNAFAETLAEVGFDLVTTANNHTLDAYPEGVFSTLNLLDSLGIRHVGTARDSAEKRQLCLIEPKIRNYHPIHD